MSIREFEDEPDDENDLIMFGIDIGSEYDDPAIEMLDGLPVWLDDGSGSNNHDVFDPAGQQISPMQLDLHDMKFEMHIQTAQEWGSLEEIGYMVDLEPTEGEHIEHFRARILAEFLVITSSGTIWNLMNGLSIILGIDVSQIADYQEYDTGWDITLRVPTMALDNTRLTAEEVAELGEKLLSPTKDLDILSRGTFYFRTPEYYNSRSDWTDYEYGWDGLDANGDPKDTGGTYAGIVGETVFGERDTGSGYNNDYDQNYNN